MGALVPVGILMLTLTACLVPNERNTNSVEFNVPPIVDYGRLTPQSPRGTIYSDCRSFELRAENIVDRDDATLRFRFVANNRLENTRWIRDDDSPPLGAGVPQDVEHRLVVDDDLLNRSEPVVISLFVTDGPAWEDPEPVNTVTIPRDLGRIATPDGGVDADHAVVEVRWFFTFSTDLGGCPE